jgi:hypothetical protein
VSDRPRSAAAVEGFPYGWPGLVCYFDAEHRQAHTRDDLRGMVSRALAGQTTIYAVWPGEYRSDLFVIDDPAKLHEAIRPRR